MEHIDPKLVFNTSRFDDKKIDSNNADRLMKERREEATNYQTESAAIDDIRFEILEMIETPKRKDRFEATLAALNSTQHNGFNGFGGNNDDSKDATSPNAAGSADTADAARDFFHCRQDGAPSMEEILNRWKDDLTESGLQDDVFLQLGYVFQWKNCFA